MKLKTNWLKRTYFSLTATAALAFAGLSANAHSETVLNAVFYQPDGNPIVELSREALEMVSEETDGRVKFRIYPSSTLVPTTEMANAVDNGTAFMAVWYMPYMSKTIPLFDIETVPVWTAGTCDAIVDTYENGLNDLYSEALANQGMPNVQVAGVSMCLPRVLGTTKTPVQVPDDVKGLRIRSVAAESEMFAEIGANPVNMTNDQVYEALSRGIVDGMTNAFNVMDERKDLEMIKYVVNTDLTWVLMHVIYNESMLDKLDEKDREIVQKGMKQVANYVREGLDKRSEHSKETAPERYDVTVHQPNDNERKLWLAAAESTRQKFESKADGDEFIKRGLDLVHTYNPVD